MSEYRFIEITIDFKDDQTLCKLWIKDIAGRGNYVLIGGAVPPSGSVIVSTEGRAQTIRIPLEISFDSANLKAVRELNFAVDSEISQGGHSFTVSRITFVKP